VTKEKGETRRKVLPEKGKNIVADDLLEEEPNVRKKWDGEAVESCPKSTSLRRRAS